MADSTTASPGPNPSGLCMCGCGQPAPIAKQSHTRNGWVVGKPMRYILGHRGKVNGESPVCSVDGCERTANAHGMCSLHYSRWKVYGTPTVTLLRDLPEQERFWAQVQKAGPGECWTWTGGHTGSGYGSFSVRRGLAYPAHRYAYEQMVGEIPDGLELDHLCRNPGCVNPAHLESVTHDENMKRADGAIGKRSAATHCPSGHPYDDVNTDYHNGRRHCRECARLRRRAKEGG